MDEKYKIDTAKNKAFFGEMREGLLRFGHRFPSPEGSSYYLGEDGMPCGEKPRETWITCRMAHVYSIGTLLGHEGSEELVDAALRGLTGELCDKENGGWYPGIRADGEPLPGKQCYGHAFVILAAASASLAGRPHAKELLADALATYDRFFWQEDVGLSCDTWDTRFSALDDYRGLNSNMHTVEAFLAVADVTGDGKYRDRAGRIIRHVIGWASRNGWRIPEHFTKDWEPDLDCNKERPADPFKPYGATPGHGIEWSRLIAQWALSACHDASLYLEVAENLYGRAVADAWDVDGAPGIVYTTDWEGKAVVHDRMHWTLAEAVNASAVLYRATGKERYAGNYAMFLEYVDHFLLDRQHGSWFHQLDVGNRVIGTVWPGKPDLYHAFQATLIPYCRPDLSVASAVASGQAGIS